MALPPDKRAEAIDLAIAVFGKPPGRPNDEEAALFLDLATLDALRLFVRRLCEAVLEHDYDTAEILARQLIHPVL
jgi:hypothetical protein